MKRAILIATLLALSAAGCASLREGIRGGITSEGGKPGEEPWIRVGLSTDASFVEVTADREMELNLREPGGDSRHGARKIGQQLRVALEAGLALTGGNDYRENLPAQDTLLLDFGSHSLESRFLWNGKHYTGRLLIFRNSRSTLSVVNVVPVERYLAGVVPAEIGRSSAGAEAIKAQAVAARTYALFYLGRRAAEGFDLFGTVEDQVYGGLESEDASTSALIAGTRGLVLMAGGRPVRAMYSASCGGMCAALDEAFPSPSLPYLAAHRDRSPDLNPTTSFCSDAPIYRWHEEWPLDQFEQILAQYGPAEWRSPDGNLQGRVLDVRVAQRSVSGRVKRLEIETTTGVYALDEMKIRATLRRPIEGRPILRSTLFKIGVDYDGDTPTRVVAQGAGNGHGVGLCQYGARGMAARGFTYAQILLHYYRGAGLASWYI